MDQRGRRPSRRRRPVLASEARAAYQARPVRPARPAVGLRDALAGLDAAISTLAAVDLDGEDDREVLDALVEGQRLADRLAAAQLSALGHAKRREAYRADGAVTLASWYRARTRLDPGEATRRVHAATRLAHFPSLQAALAAGTVGLGHVTAITTAAVPQRLDAIVTHEATLLTLAQRAGPREVRVALARIAELVDADGTDTPPLPQGGPDVRRHLAVWPGVDGLGQIAGTLDQLDTEALLTVLDALETADPPDTPPEQRRSPGQRRADALGLLARLALDKGLAPTVQGAKPHLLLTADIADLLALLHTLITDRHPHPGNDGDDEDGSRGGDQADTGAGWCGDDTGGDAGRGAAGAGGGGLDITDLLGAAAARTAFGDDGPPEPRPDPAHPTGPDDPAEPVEPDDPRPAGRPTAYGSADPGDVHGLRDVLGPLGLEALTAADLADLLTAGTATAVADTATGPGRAGRVPRLRWTGPLDPARFARLALQAKLTLVLTAGPYRPVSVGRTMRVLPPWLRTIVELIHRHCRGPDCDRPAVWTQPHHQDAWDDGGETDVNTTIPVCHAHHDLITTGPWTAVLDPTTGTCTWTNHHHHTTRRTRPPPP